MKPNAVDAILATNPRYASATPASWSRNIPPASKYNVVFAGRNTHVARLVCERLTEDAIEENCNLVADAKLNAAKAIVANDVFEVLHAVSQWMIPGMNWTDEIGEQLKRDTQIALAAWRELTS